MQNKFELQGYIDTNQQLDILEDFVIKMEIEGDAVVQFNGRGQFYFLCTKECNLFHHYPDNGWLIVQTHPFNKKLIIGTGLYEDTSIVGYFYNFDNLEKVQLWYDIINFTYRSDFCQIYYPLDNYFKFVKLNGSSCFYLYDYLPVSRSEKASTEMRKITNLLFRMKDGLAVSLTVKLFSLALSRLYMVKNRKDQFILIPIPASTSERNQARFSTFCHLLSAKTGIKNGYSAIQINEDREQLKGARSVDKISNLTFKPNYFKGWHVILIDDVLNTGEGFFQIKKELMALGAKSVIGVFLVKTIA